MPFDRDDHRAYEDLAVRLVMGGLPDGQASAFRSHLMDCGECRARVGELRSIDSDLAEVERSARRERAASRVETKQRAAPPDVETPRVERDRRRGRPWIAAGVALIVLLSSWNFVLRGQVDALRGALGAEQTAAAVMNFGTAWDPAVAAEGLEVVARSLDRSVALMASGTDDAATYRVSLLAADGQLRRTEAVASVDGRLRYLATGVDDAVVRIELALPRADDTSTVLYRADRAS